MNMSNIRCCLCPNLRAVDVVQEIWAVRGVGDGHVDHVVLLIQELGTIHAENR